MGRMIAAIACGIVLAAGVAFVGFGVWMLVGALRQLGGDVGSIAAEQGFFVAFGSLAFGALVVAVSSIAYLRVKRTSTRRRRIVR
jgi:hypothetical protein